MENQIFGFSSQEKCFLKSVCGKVSIDEFRDGVGENLSGKQINYHTDIGYIIGNSGVSNVTDPDLVWPWLFKFPTQTIGIVAILPLKGSVFLQGFRRV